MIPDLGKYAGPVLWSYALSVLILGLIIAVSIWRARAVKRQLNAAEARTTRTSENS